MPHFILEKHEKDFQKILNMLRSYFNITMTSQVNVRPGCRRRAAVRFFFVSMDWYRYVRLIEPSIGVQWGQEKPKPRAYHFRGKRGLPSFLLNLGPEGWDFPGTIEQ